MGPLTELTFRGAVLGCPINAPATSQGASVLAVNQTPPRRVGLRQGPPLISDFIERAPRDMQMSVSDLTLLFGKIEQGDAKAVDALWPLVYDELRKLAANKLAREQPGQTLQATALVHEAWLRLGGDEQPNWANRAHFFGAAAEAMRRILVDRARHRQAVRHGGGQMRVEADHSELAGAPENDAQLLAVNEAVDRLGREHPAKARLVELRYFAGLTIAEAAQVLDISEPTAKRWWAFARAWLYHEIHRL